MYFDGGCKNNGQKNAKGSYGFVIMQGDQIIKEGSGMVTGESYVSNNVAEYHGLIRGLIAVAQMLRNEELPRDTHVTVQGDSNMVISVMAKEWGNKNGYWRPHPKHPHLQRLALMADGVATTHFTSFNFQWAARKHNTHADALASSEL